MTKRLQMPEYRAPSTPIILMSASDKIVTQSHCDDLAFKRGWTYFEYRRYYAEPGHFLSFPGDPVYKYDLALDFWSGLLKG